MFPISDSVKSRSFPLLNLFMIGLNIYVFMQQLAAPDLDAFILQFAFIPGRVSIMDPTTLLPFITSMFLHGSFFHLASNMLFLWVFGDNIEGYYGKVRYLIIFLVSGMVGSLLQFALNPGSTIPMLGASGAISGILGAYYISHPHSKVKTLLPIFLFLTVVEIPAVIYLFYWFAIQVFSGLWGLGGIQNETGGVAFFAHIGGFVTGIILAKVFGNRDKNGVIDAEIVSD